MIPARRCLVLSALALPALVACGGPGSFDGTVNGITMSVKDAVFLTPKDGNGNVVGLVLSMSDQPGLCASLQAQQVVHDSTNFVASLACFSSNQLPHRSKSDKRHSHIFFVGAALRGRPCNAFDPRRAATEGRPYNRATRST